MLGEGWKNAEEKLTAENILSGSYWQFKFRCYLTAVNRGGKFDSTFCESVCRFGKILRSS